MKIGRTIEEGIPGVETSSFDEDFNTCAQYLLSSIGLFLFRLPAWPKADVNDSSHSAGTFKMYPVYKVLGLFSCHQLFKKLIFSAIV